MMSMARWSALSSRAQLLALDEVRGLSLARGLHLREVLLVLLLRGLRRHGVAAALRGVLLALRRLGRLRVALVRHVGDGHRELLLDQLVGVARLGLLLLRLRALVRDVALHLLDRLQDAAARGLERGARLVLRNAFGARLQGRDRLLRLRRELDQRVADVDRVGLDLADRVARGADGLAVVRVELLVVRALLLAHLRGGLL